MDKFDDLPDVPDDVADTLGDLADNPDFHKFVEAFARSLISAGDNAVIASLPPDYGHKSGERAAAFIKMSDSLTSDVFWRVLHRLWPHLHLAENTAFISAMAKHRSKWSKAHMEAKNANVLRTLPKKVKVYRGQGKDQPHGIAWTRNKHIASWFSAGVPHQNTHPVVISGVVDRRNIAGVFEQRLESEVILFDPADVHDIQIEDTPRHVVDMALSHISYDFLQLMQGKSVEIDINSTAPPAYHLFALPGVDLNIYSLVAKPSDMPFEKYGNDIAHQMLNIASKMGLSVIIDNLRVRALKDDDEIIKVKNIFSSLDDDIAVAIREMSNTHLSIYPAEKGLFNETGIII